MVSILRPILICISLFFIYTASAFAVENFSSECPDGLEAKDIDGKLYCCYEEDDDYTCVHTPQDVCTSEKAANETIITQHYSIRKGGLCIGENCMGKKTEKYWEFGEDNYIEYICKCSDENTCGWEEHCTTSNEFLGTCDYFELSCHNCEAPSKLVYHPLTYIDITNTTTTCDSEENPKEASSPNDESENLKSASEKLQQLYEEQFRFVNTLSVLQADEPHTPTCPPKDPNKRDDRLFRDFLPF